MIDTEFIPQMEPWLGDEEKRAIADYMDTGGWLTEFRNTDQFEQAIAEFVGAKHCIASCNGTTALMMINYCLSFRPGDEVIVPNYTMIATPNSVVAAGATPVFVDVEPDTLCMDLTAAKAALTSRTRAILYVAANGRFPSAGIGPLRDFAASNGLAFIEDACQALGSWYAPGQHIGTVGLAASFSFSVPKVITTGQGGAVITNDDAFAAKLRRSKDFGRNGGGNDVHGSIGYNFKFTEMQAVIGLEQMKKLPARVERKKAILRRYRERLAPVSAIRFFEQDLVLTTPWFIDVEVERRESLQAHLKSLGIGTRIMYPPINKQEAYDVSGEHPVSNRIGERGLWLPSAAQLTDPQIDRICDAITDFYV